MHRTMIGWALAGVLLVVGLTVTLFLVKSRKDKTLICPTCKQQLKHEGAECGNCAWKKRLESRDTTPMLSPGTKLAVGAGVLSLLLSLLYLPRLRTLFRGAKPVPMVLMRCSQCKRKLTYLASSAGRNATCPGCGVKFTYPRPGGQVV